VKFTLFQDSRIGGRQRNEDRTAYRYTREALVMVLADGLGGHSDGDLAADAAVRSIIALFERQATPRLAQPSHFLADAMAGAHTAVLGQSGVRPMREMPRTTCVCCIVQDGIAHWAHSGDSRLYVLRQQRVLMKTSDHSRVQDLVDAGQLSAAGARSHPARNVLTSCIGGDLLPRFTFSTPFILMPGDIILLCTDGLWGPLTDEQALADQLFPDAITHAPALLDHVESIAGDQRDNLSLILLAWGDNVLDNRNHKHHHPSKEFS
jgi:serine/threonine protein phosphatase PrpC